MRGKIFRLKIILLQNKYNRGESPDYGEKMKYKIFWIILLLLFLYNAKRYDIDDHAEMPYNKGNTVDEIYRG
jgi:hypothetical protein